MSGFEIFGTLGSAVAVIEAIWLAKSYVVSISRAKQDQVDMKIELKELNAIVQQLRTALERQPSLNTRSMLLPILSKVEEGLNKIDKKRKGAWTIFWHKVKDDIRSMWGDLERMKGFLELGLISQVEEGVSEHREESKSRYTTMMTELKQELSDIRKEMFRGNIRIEKSLDATPGNPTLVVLRFSPCELDELRKKRSKFSGNWLLESDIMKEWLDRSSKKKLVIVTGPAGCGKTILSSTVADFLNESGETFLPIFIKYAAHMDFSAVIRSLLATTLSFKTTLHPRLIELYSKKSFQETTLSTILQNELSAHFRPVYMILDGLDELDYSKADLLDSLSTIANVRLFVTSRPSAVPGHFQSAIVDLEGSNEIDLYAYVRDGVTTICTKLHRCEASVEQVAKQVLDASRGLFILASMHITTLEKAKTKRELINLAGRLLKTPNEYYSSTLGRIRNRESIDSDPALASLLWVFHAKRPLRVQDLPIAVASVLYDLTGEVVEDCIRQPEELLRLCEGLLCAQDHVVRFSRNPSCHKLFATSTDDTYSDLTVQEFFQDAGEAAFVLSSAWSGKSQVPCLGVACLNFLNARHDPSTLMEWRVSIFHSWRHPDATFFVYASQFWGEHISPNPTSQALQALSLLENNSSVLDLASTYLTIHWNIWAASYTLTQHHMVAAFNLVSYLKKMPGKRTMDLENCGGRSSLSYACLLGNIEVVRFLLAQPDIEADSRDVDGFSPFWGACRFGHIDIVKLLMARSDVQADSRGQHGESPLYGGSYGGHAEICKLLLERPDVEADSRAEDGQSPLFVACSNGQVQCASLLLARSDVEVDFCDVGGRSPFWSACDNGHIEIARLLLERPDVNADSRDNTGRSPLCAACRNGHIDIARLLLERPDVEPDSRDYNGRSPLWYACRDGRVDLTLLLLGTPGVNADFFDMEGQSPLGIACCNGHVEISNLLIARPDVDPDFCPENGQLPLIMACTNGHFEIARILLERPNVKADIQDTNAGRSPLSMACGYGHVEFASFLLAKPEVDADSRDWQGQSPLWYACQHGHVEIARTLLSRPYIEANIHNNCGLSPLSTACSNGHVRIAKLLLKRHDVNVDSRDNAGRSPLSMACSRGHLAIVSLLLARPEVEADSRDEYGQSPLWHACRNGHIDIVRLLLARSDIDVNFCDKEGQSPFLLACYGGNVQISSLLLETTDVQADSRDKYGRSPLWHACRYGYVEIVRLLLARPDVKIDSRDMQGHSPLWAACVDRHTEIVELLRMRLSVKGVI